MYNTGRGNTEITMKAVATPGAGGKRGLPVWGYQNLDFGGRILQNWRILDFGQEKDITWVLLAPLKCQFCKCVKMSQGLEATAIIGDEELLLGIILSGIRRQERNNLFVSSCLPISL